MVSLLDERGTPAIARRTLIAPPSSRLNAITDAERQAVIKGSTVFGTYENAVDRESAYEQLAKKRLEAAEGRSDDGSSNKSSSSVLGDLFGGGQSSGRKRQSPLEAMFVSAARSIGSQLGRSISRGVFGSILGSSSRRRR